MALHCHLPPQGATTDAAFGITWQALTYGAHSSGVDMTGFDSIFFEATYGRSRVVGQVSRCARSGSETMATNSGRIP